jgi:hypothetical protein
MFYKTIIESSSNEEDNDSELMMAAAMLIHEHNSRHVHKGLIKGQRANVKPNHPKGHYQLYQREVSLARVWRVDVQTQHLSLNPHKCELTFLFILEDQVFWDSCNLS